MLSVLFLEARGRAAHLTQSETGKYEHVRAPGRTEDRGDGAHLGVRPILEIARTTVTYAPRRSVLFLEAWVRAARLTQGETEKYDQHAPGRETSSGGAARQTSSQTARTLVCR